MATTEDKEPEGYLRIRLGLHDTHYPNGLIPAATILRLFPGMIRFLIAPLAPAVSQPFRKQEQAFHR